MESSEEMMELSPILKYVSMFIPAVCSRRKAAGGCLVRERKSSQKGRLKEL